MPIDDDVKVSSRRNFVGTEDGQICMDRHMMHILMDQYRDAPTDLADASLVAVAETLSLRTVFTIDRHFYAYRTADKQAFQVVP